MFFCKLCPTVLQIVLFKTSLFFASPSLSLTLPTLITPSFTPLYLLPSLSLSPLSSPPPSLPCTSFPLSHSPHSHLLLLYSPVPPSLSLTLPTLIPSIFTPLYLLPSSPPSSFLLHCQHACLGSDETDDCGMTCLMWAAYNNSPEVVKGLLDRGAEVEEKDVDGLTALHW